MKSEENKKEDVWLVISDLFSTVIGPARDWPEATLTCTLEEMAHHFHSSFPEVEFNLEDLRLALHNMGVPYERNEHNNKFYYLAVWR